MSANELLIAIGVSRPSGLPQLAGLDSTTDDIVRWAKARSMDVIKINDFAGTPVLGEAIKTSLPRNVLVERDRIVVYFCGHGFFVNGEAGWILSGGPNDWTSIVGVLKFRDMLGSYGAANVAIWSDACQSLKNVAGGASPVLPPGPQIGNLPKTDLFFATREGGVAYVVQDAGSWKPLFSQVIADALVQSPPPPEAIDALYQVERGLIITNQSLGNFIDSEVPKRASNLNLSQSPNTLTGLRGVHSIYRLVDSGVASVTRDFNRGPGGALISRSGQSIDQTRATTADLNYSRDDFERRTESEWRITFWRKGIGIHPAFGSIYTQFDHASDFILGKASSHVSFGNNSVIVSHSPDLWSVLPYYEALACLLAVKTSIESSGADDQGINAIGWLDPNFPPLGNNNDVNFKYSDDPMRILKGYLIGSMRSIDVQKMISGYRRGKNTNPMLGIIAAYYYDAIGDIDNIRRTASYYADPETRQAIPIDVAMICRVPLKFTEHIGLSIDLPGVGESAPPFPDAPDFVWRARQPIPDARIAGIAPVLLAGWRFLDMLPDGVRQLIAGFAEKLTKAPISTFRTSNGASDLTITKS